MAHALLGAVTCGRCGARVAAAVSACSRCTSPRLDAAPGTATGPYQGMLIGVVPAAAGRRYAARAVDALPPLALLGAAAVGAFDGRWAVLVVVALALMAANAVSSVRSGQTLGRRLLRLRTVDDLSGAPLTAMDRLGRIPRVLRQRTTMTADLRAGRDPLGVARPPADALGEDALDADDTAPTVDEAVRRAHRRTAAPAAEAPVATAAALVLDSGERLPVVAPLVVGRKPEAQVDGVTHRVHPWADLSRTVAKSHALFAWSGSTMWITDLGSLSGTAIITADGERRPLVAGVPTAASVGWIVELGRRRITIEADVPGATATPTGDAPRSEATDAGASSAGAPAASGSATALPADPRPGAAALAATSAAPTPTERTAHRAD